MKPSQKGIPKKQYTLVQRAIMVHHWSRKSRNVRKATFLANNPDHFLKKKLFNGLMKKVQ